MHKFALLAVLALAACGDKVTPEEQERLDEKAIAEVESVQTPPPDEPTPETMSFADFERSNIFGLGCSFVPSGGGEDPIAVTLIDKGYMKFRGEIEQFAPDTGSPETPYGTRVKYDGGRHAMTFELLDSSGRQVGMETLAHEARLTLRDGRNRIVFAAQGKALCGA